MSTRSYIVLKEDEKYTSIYCHFDGYLSYVGNILLTHYSDKEKVKRLLDLGDLSILGEDLGEKQDFDDYKNRNPKWCLAYGRDRGEDNIKARTHNSLKELRSYFKYSWCEYVYIYDTKKSKWYYFTSRNPVLKKLTAEAIREDN